MRSNAIPERKCSFTLPAALWRRVKVACLDRGVTFKRFLITALEHELRREA